MSVMLVMLVESTSNIAGRILSYQIRTTHFQNGAHREKCQISVISANNSLTITNDQVSTNLRRAKFITTIRSVPCTITIKQ